MRSSASHLLLIVILTCFMGSVPAWASTQWRTRAVMDVTAPGLVETIVPPGLVSARDRDTYDLLLTGPDGNPRAFELYWRDPVDRIRHTLTPRNVRLTEQHVFVWEADIPPGIMMDRLEVRLAEAQHIGRMDVEGLLPDGWRVLVEDAAVYPSGDKTHTVLDVEKARYEKIRLSLTGYDKKTGSALSPIHSAVVGGLREGKDFAGESFLLDFQYSEHPDHFDLEASLPGPGLYIDTLTVRTRVQFMGRWEAGHFLIAEGQKRFTPILRGNVVHMAEGGQELKIDIHRQWPARPLVLRLYPRDRYVGEVLELTARARLPRLVFSADVSGLYTAHTGSGKRVRILTYPGRSNRNVDQRSRFGPVETNPQWRIETLVEKYQLKGGPFDPEGYSWKALVPVSHPGYYRFRLTDSAGLAPNAKGVRLAREGVQVPFFFGPEEIREIVISWDATYDAKANRTVWRLQLPLPSPQWRYLELKASGIFKREVVMSFPDANGPGRQSTRRVTWENHENEPASIRLPLTGTARDQRSIEISMDHGDNQPLEIDEIRGYYLASALYFLAHSEGTYELFGGHPTLGVPRYDLSLVQRELMAAIPDRVEMGDPLPLETGPWHGRITRYFKETNLGLYAVLALVTLVLLVIVVRMLPKPGAGGETGTPE